MEILQIIICFLLLAVAFVGGYIAGVQDRTEIEQYNKNAFEFITLKKPTSTK